MATETTSPVAFLLGAGASADARIPVMRVMHEAFIAQQTAEDQRFLRRVEAATLPYATKLGREVVDTELLLAGLQRFASLPDDLSRHLLEVHAPPADPLRQAARLATALRAHIREQCLIPTEQDVEYLQPLIRLTNTCSHVGYRMRGESQEWARKVRMQTTTGLDGPRWWGWARSPSSSRGLGWRSRQRSIPEAL